MHKPSGDFGGRCHLSFLENHQRRAIIKLLALSETETILMAMAVVGWCVSVLGSPKSLEIDQFAIHFVLA